jgi:multisubunit Na+/H+ antiporter MnhG subunit
MNAGVGLALIVAGSLLALLTVFGLWRRLPEPAALVVLATAGAIVGAGALLVQYDPGPGDWALTLLVLGVGTPLHGRLVFGAPRRSP